MGKRSLNAIFPVDGYLVKMGSVSAEAVLKPAILKFDGPVFVQNLNFLLGEFTGYRKLYNVGKLAFGARKDI